MANIADEIHVSVTTKIIDLIFDINPEILFVRHCFLLKSKALNYVRFKITLLNHDHQGYVLRAHYTTISISVVIFQRFTFYRGESLD